MRAGKDRVLRYAVINTAPMVEVIRTSCRPKLQWMRPKATAEITTMANELFVYLLMNVCM
jgi:hypothetical protein